MPRLRPIIDYLLFPPARLAQEALVRHVIGRRVLITGASHGIGWEVARRLGAAGAELILVARSADRLEALATDIVSQGGRASVWVTDLTDATQVERLAEALSAQPVDIFVSNAGKSIRRSLFHSLDRFHDVTRTIGVNYLGPVRLILALVPGLRMGGGQIISISAANVLLPPAFRWSAYQASKSAADQWLRCAAPELRAAGVAVTTVYLPLVRTRMIAPTEHYAGMPAMDPEQAAQLVCREIVRRGRRWQPWWLAPVAVAGTVLRLPVEWAMDRLARRVGPDAMP